MQYLLYEHKNFMLSQISNQCRVQFLFLLAASVTLAQGGGLLPFAHSTHCYCYPALLWNRLAKPHVLSMSHTTDSPLLPHHSLVHTSHGLSVTATVVHPCRSIAAGHSTAWLCGPGLCCLQHSERRHRKHFCLLSSPNSTSLMLSTPCLSPLQS